MFAYRPRVCGFGGGEGELAPTIWKVRDDMRKCPGCGKAYELASGAILPAHPDVRWFPVFRWCVFGDRSGVVVGVES